MPAPLVSLAVIAAAGALLVALERSFPYDPRQRLLRRGFWTDLIGYTLLQNWILGNVIGLAITAFTAALGGPFRAISGWSLAGQCLLFLFLHDLYIYWFHRLQHRSPLLWRIHEAHHSTADVDWLSGTRSHFLEILVNQTIEFAPLALLGAPAAVWYFKVTIDAVWGMYIHSNVDVRSGRLQYVLNGPEMHRWHHSAEIVRGNFATKFAFWDWIFGTAHRPPEKPVGYGLVDADYPTGFLAQALQAFRATATPAERRS